MPADAARPAVRAGIDARVLAAQGIAYGDAQSRRLCQARTNYAMIREAYEKGIPQLRKLSDAEIASMCSAYLASLRGQGARR